MLFSYLVVLGAGGCELPNPRGELARQLELCNLAERAGILDAIDACGAALGIVEGGGHPPKQVSQLIYRLGRLERRRRNFAAAEEFVLRSIAIEEETRDRAGLGARMVEWSINLAGQFR